MRGENHSLATIMIAFPTFFALENFTDSVYYTNALLFVMSGVLFGCLIPDIDASDSKVMHGTWKPIGVATKYLFYKPMVRLFGLRTTTYSDEHRGFMHSFIGCTLASLFFILPVGMLYVLATHIWLISIEYASYLWFIWIGIPIGFILHLAEDSFTRTGVRWFFPRDRLLRSTTQTFGESERGIVSLIFIVYGMFSIMAFFLPASTLMIISTLAISAALLYPLYRINPRISQKSQEWEILQNEGIVQPIEADSLRKEVEECIVGSGGRRVIEEGVACSYLRVEADGVPKPYISRIVGVGGRFRLKRVFLENSIEARKMKEGDVVEVRRNAHGRMYFYVKSGVFQLFVQE